MIEDKNQDVINTIPDWPGNSHQPDLTMICK